MSLYQVQKLLFKVHNDLKLRGQFTADPSAIMADYSLTAEEERSLLGKDMRTLYRMGVNPWLLLQYAHISGVETGDYLRQIREE